MVNILKSLIPAYLRIKLNHFKTRYRYDVILGYMSYVQDTFFEGKNLVNNYSVISSSYIGLGTYISGNCKLTKIKTGKFCSVGQNVTNKFSTHPSSVFVSTHPAFFSTKKQAGFSFVDKNVFEESKYVDKDKKFHTEIGNDVWIGNDVKIMEGITIGDGAIIATGAIVTKDVEPYAIVGGVPAKLIRYRFDKVDRDFLLNLKWWDKNLEWQQKYAPYFRSVDELRNEIS